MWTLAQHTVLACIPLHFIDSRLGITTCTDVDTERRSEKWTEVHNFYVWHSFARWYSVTVQFNWGGSFAHSSIKTLLLMHSESWPAWMLTWLDPCGEHFTGNRPLYGAQITCHVCFSLWTCTRVPQLYHLVFVHFNAWNEKVILTLSSLLSTDQQPLQSRMDLWFLIQVSTFQICGDRVCSAQKNWRDI